MMRTRRINALMFSAAMLVFASFCGPACAEDPVISEQVRTYGSPRSRAPNGWPSFEWKEKREVLFGFYGPTDVETRMVSEAVSTLKSRRPAKKRKLLVFYRCQYPHASIATGCLAFDQIGLQTGAYEPTLTDDPADINLENLAKYDALLLNNTTNFDVTVGAAGQKAILDYVRGGGGLIGIHAAADSSRGWQEGRRLINGVFWCHPWLPAGTWAFQLESPAHPLNLSFDNKGFWHRDEIYAYRDGSHSRDHSRVLISLDADQPHNREAKELHPKQKPLAQQETVRPVAWIHTFGQGRVFYSNFGHNNSTFWHPPILQHYVDGIQYALGDVEADATPSSRLTKTETAPAPAAETP